MASYAASDPAAPTTPPPSSRSMVRRLPQRAAYDLAAVHEVLDEGLVAHVGLVADGVPVVIPTGYVRDGDRLLLHGASSSRLMRALASGATACVTVTLLDGLVVARSAFHHSMNYRSAVLFGTATVLEGSEKWDAMRTYVERIVPGRWEQCRQPNEQETKATMVVAFPIDEASAKARRGPPGDEPEDLAFPCWSGVIPLSLTAAPPQQDPTQAAAPPPANVARWSPAQRS